MAVELIVLELCNGDVVIYYCVWRRRCSAMAALCSIEEGELLYCGDSVLDGGEYTMCLRWRYWACTCCAAWEMLGVYVLCCVLPSMELCLCLY